jgi:crotonobetainyl-CoA:carnitine CoA-transferase CaiB-like acyl-CoA transferase
MDTQHHSSSDAPLPAPLEGLRVLDFSRLLPGPLATRMMAEQGAEVIKIEHPTRQDPVRSYPPFVGKRNAYDLVLNAGKRHLLVDPKQEQGRDLILRLIDRSDVLLESFRPGVMATLGLGVEACLQRNPRLIYASLTGFGQHGPNADLAGHDLNFQALSGILHWSRDADGHPQHPGLPLADVAGGSYGVLQAILAALWQRERSGRGRHVDVSMTAAIAPVASLAAATHEAAAQVGLPQLSPQQGPLSGGLARYGLYACQDGRWMALAALEPKFWSRFCEAVDRKEWMDNLSFNADDQHNMRSDLEVMFKTKSQAEWTELGRRADCCLTPVLEPEAWHAGLEAEDQSARKTTDAVWWTHESVASLPIFPVAGQHRSPAQKAGDAPTRPLQQAPLPGQHSRSIMDELGYSSTEQQALLEAKIVAGR